MGLESEYDADGVPYKLFPDFNIILFLHSG